MYIRRKVFSLLEDETGEERYFSTTDITLENEEIRLFARRDYEGLSKVDADALRTKRNILASAIRDVRKYDDNTVKYSFDKNKKPNTLSHAGVRTTRWSGIQVDAQNIPNTKRKFLESDKDFIARHRKNLNERLLNESEKAKTAIKYSEEETRNLRDKITEAEKEIKKLKTSTPTSKKRFKLGKAGKIALGTAAVAGAAYGAKKLYDKKKKDKE